MCLCFVVEWIILALSLCNDFAIKSEQATCIRNNMKGECFTKPGKENNTYSECFHAYEAVAIKTTAVLIPSKLNKLVIELSF